MDEEQDEPRDRGLPWGQRCPPVTAQYNGPGRSRPTRQGEAGVTARGLKAAIGRWRSGGHEVAGGDRPTDAAGEA